MSTDLFMCERYYYTYQLLTVMGYIGSLVNEINTTFHISGNTTFLIYLMLSTNLNCFNTFLQHTFIINLDYSSYSTILHLSCSEEHQFQYRSASIPIYTVACMAHSGQSVKAQVLEYKNKRAMVLYHSNTE